MTTRKITTFYTAADGSEPDVTVDVTLLNCFDVEVTDLDELPDAEIAGVTERATAAFWAAERSAYLLGGGDGEDHAEEIRDERSDEDVYAGCE